MQAHHGWRRSLGFVSSALLALALLAPGAGRAACRVKFAELPVHMVGVRAIATIGINDQDVPLTVDTGAFFSFLNEAAAAQSKLSRDTIPGIDFIVGGNEMGSGAMGVIGRNLLNFADTEYDLAHGMIRFVFPDDDCEKKVRLGNADASQADLAAARKLQATIAEDMREPGLSEQQPGGRP
jgi:hypothetical protein